MTTPILLNYRHSLKTMREQLAHHNETIRFYQQCGSTIYIVIKPNGKITERIDVFFNTKDLAEYINKRNGYGKKES